MPRTKTKGNRSTGGRKKRPTTTAARLAAMAYDHGNDAVRKRRDLFDCLAIKGGKAVDHVFDGIGQLWALDFLEGHGIPGDTLRDAGRLYAELYWERYSMTAPTIANYERRTPNGNGPAPLKTRRDMLFDRLDASLPLNTHERGAVWTLVCDFHHKDGMVHWAEAIVKRELLERKRVPEAMRFPDGNDYALLSAALRGLCWLAEGSVPMRRAA